VKIDAPIPFEKRTSLRLPLISVSVEERLPSPFNDDLERGIDLTEVSIVDTSLAPTEQSS